MKKIYLIVRTDKYHSQSMHDIIGIYTSIMQASENFFQAIEENPEDVHLMMEVPDGLLSIDGTIYDHAVVVSQTHSKEKEQHD